MTVFAYYTPQIATPINDRRAGTIRLGSDAPHPIIVNKGFNNQLMFGFRDEAQKVFLLDGRTVTGTIYNQSNVQMLTVPMKVSVTTAGIATLDLTDINLEAFEEGMYNLIITYVDNFGVTYPVSTTRSLPRFVIDVIDFVTP